MDAQAYLSRAYRLDRAIRVKHEQLDRLIAQATRSTSAVNAMKAGGAPVSSKFEKAADAYIDLQNELGAQIVEYHSTYREIEAAISGIGDERLSELLRYRYLCFMKWEQIADKMGYGLRWIMRVHATALKAIESHV